jgi:hypothetical protein
MESTEMIRNGTQQRKDDVIEQLTYQPQRFRYIGEMLFAVGAALLVLIVMTAIVSFTWLITTSLYHRFTSP